MENKEIYWLVLTVVLTSTIWVPYILERILRVGLFAALGLVEADKEKANAAPNWAIRMMKAHSNAVENMVIFAPLILTLAILNVSTEVTVQASMIYFFARLVHLIVYTFKIPVLRTLSFLVGFACQLFLAHALLGAL